MDIDCVDIRDKGLLVIYEFKRKTPAYKLISLGCENKVTFDDLKIVYEHAEKLICDIVGKYPKYKYSELQEKFSSGLRSLSKSFPLDGFNFSWPYGGMYNFSLDYSHIQNVEFSERVGARYVYVVWNQECRNMLDMNALLDFDLRPLSEFDFKVCRGVTIGKVKGVTFTTGKDSGDVQKERKKPRVQFSFLDCCFDPVKK